MLKERAIKKALKPITLADGTPLLDANILGNITIHGDTAHIILDLPREDAISNKDALRAEIEQRAASVKNITKALCIITAHKKAPSTTAQSNNQANHKPDAGSNGLAKEELAGVKKIIAVASGKGGVGKSTSSVNLAMSLEQAGYNVALLDADIYGPSIPRMMGVKDAKPDINDNDQMVPIIAHNIQTISIGYMMDESQAAIWRGPMVMGALQQLLFKVAWDNVDIMIIDLPPGTGDAQLTLAQKAHLDGVIIASTPQDIALIDARKAITMFNKVDISIIGIIENMSYFTCPNCGTDHAIFATNGARDEAKKQGTAFLGAIPLALDIRMAADSGASLIHQDNDSPYSQAYKNIAHNIIKELKL